MTAAESPDGLPRSRSDLQDYLRDLLGGVCDDALLEQALTHRSYAYENGGLPHNERLEFLGDAVLGIVVTDSLYRRHPDLPEGQLAKLRAAVVNSRALADVAATIDLGGYILLGNGEESTGGRAKVSILADTTEALIGSVYLSLGMEAADTFVHHLLDPLLAHAAGLTVGLDWKTSLQELVVAGGLTGPEYLIEAEGPDHDKLFTARVLVADEVAGTGTGRTKKEAEQRAAEAAWQRLSTRVGPEQSDVVADLP